MEDQSKLNFKEKYENNPLAFAEDFYGVELYPWQKLMIEAMNIKDRVVTYCNPYRHGRDMLAKAQLEYMKLMEMDFDLWTREGIEVYEKGVLVKTLKHKKKGK